MMLVIFWFRYLILVLGLGLWVAKHPLRVGGSILFLYISGRVLVGFTVSFLVGIFLFLTGVRGMMVAFLYVVALCPNPVFRSEDERNNYFRLVFVLFTLVVVLPMVLLCSSVGIGFRVEVFSLVESAQ